MIVFFLNIQRIQRQPRSVLTHAAMAAALMAAFLTGPASADEDGPDPAGIDAVVDQLLQLPPEEVAERLASYREKLAETEAELTRLRDAAAAREAEAEAIDGRIETLLGHVQALAGLLGIPAPAVPGGEMMAASDDAESSEEMAAPEVTFAEHIEPLFRARCMRCHNDDNQRGGLSLANIASALDGGSSGPVIEPGAPDGSRLLRLVSGEEEPMMPPSGEPLSDEDLEMIRKWIALGAPADADSKVMTREEVDMGGEDAFIAAAMDAGPPPMPETELPAPAVSPRDGIPARALAASPRAPLLAVAGDQQVLLYHLEGFELLGALPFPEGEVFSLGFSLNGRFIVAAGGLPGYSGVVALYDVRSGERTGLYAEAFDVITAVDISPDHRMLAVGGTSNRVAVYSTATGNRLFDLEGHSDWINAVKYSPDGELLATADRAGGLRLWQAANGRPVEELNGHDGAIHGLSYTLNSAYLASAGEDGSVQIWDTWEYRRIRNMGNAHPGGVLSASYSQDGRLVTTGVDGEVKCWNPNGELLHTYAPLPDWGYQALFAGEDQLVLAGSWHGEIIVYDAESGDARTTLSTAIVGPPATE
jgi:hypothetical protein